MSATTSPMSEPVTEEIARLAYLLFQGRPAESQDILRFTMTHGTLGRLRASFLSSTEFEFLLNRRARVVAPDAPPLPVTWNVADDAAQAMLTRVRQVWATVPPGLPWDAGAGRDPSGETQAQDLDATLWRNEIDPAGLARVFEFGCGAGRVARHLAAVFSHYAGCDLSPLRLAAAAQAGVPGLAAVEDLRFGMAAPFDLWISHLALQVLPPPLIARVLQRALHLLSPGGVAVFQVPTYGYGYSFDPAAAPRADAGTERHVLPQRAVFAIAVAAGCETLEAFDDLAVAPSLIWRSTVFVLRKHAG